MFIHHLSIIIPVASNETLLALLLSDLAILPKYTQIILVGSQETQDKWLSNADYKRLDLANINWLTTDKGRAWALNAGAKYAANRILWFLHADSRVSSQCILSLNHALNQKPRALIYFKLQFSNDGPKLSRINQYFAYLRSHILGLPFGDQGFCIAKDIFTNLGGYQVNCSYGEDHLFVWQAKQSQIDFVPLSASLFTSARSYQGKWFTRTLTIQISWIIQAIPQFLRYLQLKICA